MAKFNPSRVTGGTIELVRNPDGSYKSQVTGFTKIASLNLPDITTTAATTTSDATKTAAEKAQEDLKTQTSTAFKMSPAMQKNQDNQTDFSGDMTKDDHVHTIRSPTCKMIFLENQCSQKYTLGTNL